MSSARETRCVRQRACGHRCERDDCQDELRQQEALEGSSRTYILPGLSPLKQARSRACCAGGSGRRAAPAAVGGSPLSSKPSCTCQVLIHSSGLLNAPLSILLPEGCGHRAPPRFFRLGIRLPGFRRGAQEWCARGSALQAAEGLCCHAAPLTATSCRAALVRRLRWTLLQH